MRNSLLFCLLYLATHAGAQDKTHVNYDQAYGKKTWLIGLQAGYSRGLLFSHNLTMQPYGAYFIVDKVAVGLSGTGSQEGFKNIRDLSFTIGPMIRYQLTRTRFSPFLMASHQIGQRTLSGVESRTITQVTSAGTVVTSSGFIIQSQGVPRTMYSRLFSAGLSIAVNPALRIDLALNWQDKVGSINQRIRLSEGLYQPQFAINYQFGRKR